MCDKDIIKEFAEVSELVNEAFLEESEEGNGDWDYRPKTKQQYEALSRLCLLANALNDEWQMNYYLKKYVNGESH